VARNRISRNAPCPCGSGKKYKHCCCGKGFSYEEEDEGSVFKSIPISPEVAEILEEQRQKFFEKFGREPGANDEVFFDMSPTEHIEHEMVETMRKAGIDPAIIYAYEKTGRLVTEDNLHLLSEAELTEWDAAIEEYETKHRKPPKYPIGTVAMYGPDHKTTTKIAAGVILHDGAEAIIKRWVATDVTTNPKVQQEMKDFFLQHGVKSVSMSEGNIGCPHEEGEDFPHGEDCPFCPFWKGKQGSNRKD
jgi:SEC-C motif-containing protein